MPARVILFTLFLLYILQFYRFRNDIIAPITGFELEALTGFEDDLVAPVLVGLALVGFIVGLGRVGCADFVG